MAPDTPPLTPLPIDVLLGRVAHEWATRQRIFDLPSARIWSPDADIDVGFDFLGRRCATPVGPAAGPHSQLAGNIVLAWLAGARLFELKTVQVLDDLVINRPCIDAETIGYNIEWSQELTAEQSLAEYAKAWTMIHLLSRWEPLRPHLGDHPGPFVFDMSVGYDLAGIRSAKVDGFLRGMRDARVLVEDLRSTIATSPLSAPFASLAEVDVPSRIADTLTLSTFHGCPPEEIESITKHLIDQHDLDVIVKLNPTLLGFETVSGLLRDQLGYRELSLQPAAFDADLHFDRGVELIEELRSHAADRGRRFGIKLTNTLVVDNHRSFMPEDVMYLSGPPLHVLAMSLLDRLRHALPDTFDLPGSPGEVMVSFSAGITKDNLADALATGVNPTTVCTDLLKPGGYGRLSPMLKSLTATLRTEGHTDLEAFRQGRLAAADRHGYRDPLDRHVSNALGPTRGSYDRAGTARTPRRVDHALAMFGCVACNFCVTVCPNDAFTSIKSDDLGIEQLEDRQQYVLFTELCNECGNCMTFCPEEGDPARIKPRLYRDPELFAARDGQGFLLDGATVVDARADDEQRSLVEVLVRRDAGDPFGPR